MFCSSTWKLRKRPRPASSSPPPIKKKSVIAEVISAGPGTDDVKVTVKPGDKVVTGKYAGQELKLDGEDYVIVKMADILAVVE